MSREETPVNCLPSGPVQLIAAALRHASEGRRKEGLRLIQPLVDAGPRSTFALLGALVETACVPLRLRQAVSGTWYRIEVDGPAGKESVNVLSPEVRFAAQFIAAWANRDQDTAFALVKAAVEDSEGVGGDLTAAVAVVFDTAVPAAAELFERGRRRGLHARGCCGDRR